MRALTKMTLGLPDRLAARLQQSLPGHAAQRQFEPELAYGRHAGPPPTDARRAGVMLMLCQSGGRWRLPLALRPTTMKTHAGQVALPGGVCEPGETTREAALRELFEELGIEGDEVRVLGSLTPLYVFGTNFWVEPWLGCLDNPPRYRPNPAEVAELFEISLDDLLDVRRRQSRTLGRGPISFAAPGFVSGEHFIWGATSMILAELATLLEDLPGV